MGQESKDLVITKENRLMAIKKKTTTKRTPKLFTTETITQLTPVWKNIPTGTKFEALIENKKVAGRIYKSRKGENIYLCQDKIDGAPSPNKLGYKYSWSIGSGTLKILKETGVVLTSLVLDPDFTVPKELYVSGNRVEFLLRTMRIGRTNVSYRKLIEIVKEAQTQGHITEKLTVKRKPVAKKKAPAKKVVRKTTRKR
jgi:hypothetical protein